MGADGAAPEEPAGEARRPRRLVQCDDVRHPRKLLADLLTDERVVHHWDEKRVVGRFFGGDSQFRGRGLIGWGGVMWDTYLLFGRDAEWTQRPAPLVGAGYTIIQGSQHLAADLKSALR